MIRFEEFDDWVKIYKDNQLIAEGHSFRYDQVLDLLEIDYERVFLENDG